MSQLRDGLVRFASIEPLLGPIELDNIWDWIIIGERSDTPYNPEVEVWAKDLIDQARELNIPVFVKNRLKAKFPIQELPKGEGDKEV
jgi:protein gp37